MFKKIRDYYYNCSGCGTARLVEVFGDYTAEVKRIHQCKCKQ